LEQREALPVVEFAVEVDGLDPEVKTFGQAEEFGEDAAGGVAVSKTATPPRCNCLSRTRA